MPDFVIVFIQWLSLVCLALVCLWLGSLCRFVGLIRHRVSDMRQKQSVLWREWPDYDMPCRAVDAFLEHPRFDLPGGPNGAIYDYLRGTHSAQRMEELLDARLGLDDPYRMDAAYDED